MYIGRVRLSNFKCFGRITDFIFKPGINILVGKNNSGKTSLLEALDNSTASCPHRTLDSPDGAGNSQVELMLMIAPSETRGYCSDRPVRLPIESLDIAMKDNYHFLNHEFLPYGFVKAGTGVGHQSRAFQKFYPNGPGVIARFNSQEENWSCARGETGSVYWGAPPFKPRVHKFSAERVSHGRCGVTESGRLLQPNCSNLARCLHDLQSNDEVGFTNYRKAVSFVLPEIVDINTILAGDGKSCVIRIWEHKRTPQQPELSRALNACGTGVGQVLALLFVVLSTPEPTTLLVDEPSSFLHPGATRRLIDVFRKNPQHQYIIATHSPGVISCSNPSLIHVLRRENQVVTVETLDNQEFQNARLLLEEVGAQLSDVFGADRVVWVEGPTESEAFPQIMDSLSVGLYDATFIPVRSVGDFESKKAQGLHRKMAFDVHKLLAKSNALLPPEVKFVFDREVRKPSEIKDLERSGKGDIYFLPRRLFENYLLHPPSIAEYFSELVGKHITEDELEKWLCDNASKPDYDTEKLGLEYGEVPNFYSKVHAARLLEDALGHFSDGLVPYQKTKHSVELTKRILKNEPSELEELAKFLSDDVLQVSR